MINDATLSFKCHYGPSFTTAATLSTTDLNSVKAASAKTKDKIQSQYRRRHAGKNIGKVEQIRAGYSGKMGQNGTIAVWKIKSSLGNYSETLSRFLILICGSCVSLILGVFEICHIYSNACLAQSC